MVPTASLTVQLQKHNEKLTRKHCHLYAACNDLCNIEFAGSTAVFKCQVSGEPTPKVVWSKGMKKLSTTKDKKVEVFYDEDTDQHTISMKGSYVARYKSLKTSLI